MKKKFVWILLIGLMAVSLGCAPFFSAKGLNRAETVSNTAELGDAAQANDPNVSLKQGIDLFIKENYAIHFNVKFSEKSTWIGPSENQKDLKKLLIPWVECKLYF